MRSAYCLDLIKQCWYLNGAELEVRSLTAQILHLFSHRFNIYNATSRIAEQLSAVAGSPEDEVVATLPKLSADDSQQLIDEICQAIEALIDKSARHPPTDQDFDDTLSVIVGALGAKRYVVVHCASARDPQRRLTNFLGKQLNGILRYQATILNNKDATIGALFGRLRTDLGVNTFEIIREWPPDPNALAIAGKKDCSRQVTIWTNQGAVEAFAYELQLSIKVSPRELRCLERKDSASYQELLSAATKHLKGL